MYAAAPTVSLTAGVIQLVQGVQLEWATIRAAAATLGGLALAADDVRWDQLLIGPGLLAGLAWLLVAPFGPIGGSEDFPDGGWLVGIGIYLAPYPESPPGHQARAGAPVPAGPGSGDTGTTADPGHDRDCPG